MKVIYEPGDIVYNANNYTYAIVLGEYNDVTKILEVGKMKARRFVADLFSKHLDVSMKKPSKNAEKALAKFQEFIDLEGKNP